MFGIKVQRMKSPQFQRSMVLRISAVATAVVLGLAGVRNVQAFLNEAISFALEAATPYVEEGFEVREDNWSGEVESGKPLLVKHQLFRGNEYWFWAACSYPDTEVKVDIFDLMGMPVSLETFSKDGKAGARVLPQSTDTYLIRVTVSRVKKKKGNSEEAAPEEGEQLDWGLTYGYR